MLDYVSKGQRCYGRRPMHVHSRGRWEFLAVLQGCCTMRLASNRTFPRHDRSRTLWVAGPDHWHGWTAHCQQPCRIAVFQFTSVPTEVASLVEPKGSIAVKLRESDCAQILSIAESILVERARRSPLLHLRGEHALLVLSLLVADRHGSPVPHRPEGRREQIVSSALAWFEQHMDEGPSVGDVARAARVSPQHLRRLFREVTGTSVKRRLLLAQIERARMLLARGEDKIGYIARIVGFRSHSAFSRAFRSIEGYPPQDYPTKPDALR